MSSSIFCRCGKVFVVFGLNLILGAYGCFQKYGYPKMDGL